MKCIAPQVVDWQITTQCTRCCAFCYGPTDIPALSTRDAIRLVNILAEAGTRVVGITGGEPLTRDDLPDILSAIKERGMAVCLSTNCDLYEKRREILAPLIDTLGLPIDGATSESHDLLRGTGSFDRIVSTLRVESARPEMRFRIGTVLTVSNIHELVGIEDLLSEYSRSIVYWKLYDLIRYSRSMQCHHTIPAPAEDVRATINRLGSQLPRESIVHDTHSMRHASYLLIKPNGDVFLPSLVDEIQLENTVGNLIADPHKTLQKWAQSVDVDGYTACIRCIYRKDEFLTSKFLTRERQHHDKANH